MPALTPADLAAFLAAVPISNQQRDAAVRVSPRPGLAADHRGPVAPGDVRLALSPWHWLRGELAHSPRTEALNRALAAAQAREEAPDLDTVEGAAAWVWAELETTGLDWRPVPGDPDEWGQWGPPEEADAGTGSFLPPGLALPAVLFFADDAPDGDGRIVVAQAGWSGAAGTDLGPVGVYAASDRVAAEGSAQPPWLMGWGTLLLADPASGEQAELIPRWMDDEPGEDGEETEQDAAEPGSGEWAGQEPCFEAGTFLKLDVGQEPTWLRGNLQYAAGRLLRADTGQALTLAPHLLPEPRPY